MVSSGTVTMGTLIKDIKNLGAGPKVAEAFSRIGICTVEQLMSFDGRDRELYAAIESMREDSLLDAVHWQRLFTRCVNLVFRLRNSLPTDDVPPSCMCPIDMDWFHDPVVTPAGHSYSRLAIERHLSIDQRDPVTRQPLKKEMLLDNWALAHVVRDMRIAREKFKVA